MPVLLCPHPVSRPGEPRFGRVCRAVFGLLPGLLLLAPTAGLRAQDLIPTSYDVTTEELYSRPVVAEYRRQKVRTVLVFQQVADPRRPAPPAGFRLTRYQDYDALGHLLRQYAGSGDQLTTRTQFDYAPDEQVQTATTFTRLPDPADTTRLGRVWLPASCTQYPLRPGAGTGAAALWNEQTGDWEPYQRLRTWKQRDTTYLMTTKPRTGQVTGLSRTYYVGAGEQQWREDKLALGDYAPREAEYSYALLHQKRVVEFGRLDFQKEYIDYLAAHPQDRPLQEDKPQLWQDELARHAAGHRLPMLTQTYDRHGGLLTRDGYGMRTAYERNGQGQLLQSRHYRFDELVQLTRYTFLPNGLLSQAVSFDKQGRLLATVQYYYRYY